MQAYRARERCRCASQERTTTKAKSDKSEIKDNFMRKALCMNYIHIQSVSSKEVWDKLQVVFEDSGLTRKVSLCAH